MSHTPKDPTDTNVEAGSKIETSSSSSNPEQLTTKSPNAPTIVDYLEIIARRKRIIIGITTGATLLSILYSLTLPNIYTARARILPPQQSSGLLSAAMMTGALAAMGGEMMGESKNTKLYAEILKIETLQDPIIDRFKLKEVYKQKYRQNIYKRLKKAVVIKTGKEGIITIEVDDKNPKLAADLANAHVDELRKFSASLTMTGAGNSREFLGRRIVDTRKELKEAENDMKSFQARHKILDAQTQASTTMIAMNQLSSQLSAQEIMLATLLRTYAESSQQVKNVRQSIVSLRGQIAKYEKTGSGVIPGFEGVPALGQEYLELMRKFKTAEGVYEMLVRQYETARLNETNDVSSIQVIQSATVPERKSKPIRSKIVQMSVFVSLFFSILLTFIIENLSRMDVQQKERWKGLIRLIAPSFKKTG